MQVKNSKMQYIIEQISKNSFLKKIQGNKKANLAVRLGACALMLIVIMSMMNAVQSSTSIVGVSKQIPDKLKVVDFNSGIPTITVSDGTEGNKPTKYDLKPDCIVMLNSGLAKLSELKQGDEINLKFDDNGNAIT